MGIGIKDSKNFYICIVLPVIIEEKSFGAPFSFVITSSGTNWIDIAPVALRLGMNVRISVDLACGSLEYSYLKSLGKAKHIY